MREKEKKAETRNIKIFISVIAFMGIIIHTINPFLAIDYVTVLLLLIGISPWLSSIFKSLKFGDLTIEYKDLEKIEEKLDNARLIIKPVDDKNVFMPEKEEDPILSLAWLRIEIEKKIKNLNNLCGIRNSNNFNNMLQELKEKDIISYKELSALRDLRAILNKAIHGENVDSRASEWAFSVGSEILSALDNKIETYKESCNL